jgi:RES domain-containing protein
MYSNTSERWRYSERVRSKASNRSFPRLNATRTLLKSQPIGNKWYDEGIFPILKVPSAVLPESYNYVLNATHPDCRKIKLLKTTDLIPDERIEDLLKKRR